MTKINPKNGLWMVTILWIIVVGWIWGSNEYQLVHGTEILLKTVPVDPRDLFRGDYVVLDYVIADVNKDKIVGNQYEFKKNKTVYASLMIDANNEWQVAQLFLKPPRDTFFLRGTIRSVRENGYTIQYGIENFFVPEGKGKQLEKMRDKGHLYAIVRVTSHGTARIKDVYVAGE